MNKPTYTSSLEKKPGWSRTLTVQIPESEFERQIESKLIDAQKIAELKGFRKGHAPLAIVKQNFEAKIRKDVLTDLVDLCYRHALSDHQLQPVGKPELSFIPSKSGIEFSVVFDVFPEIQVKNYEGISLVREMKSVHDDDIAHILEQLRDNHAELIPIEGRSVQPDDFVDFSYEGNLLEETKSASGKPIAQEELKGTRVFQMGKGELIAGFEEALLGLEPGQSKTFETTYPQGFQELSGKPVEFNVTVNSIKLKRLPELSDDFAKTAGFETLLDLRVKARESIEAERKTQSQRTLENDLIKKLIDQNPFELPNSLVEDEKKQLQAEWVQLLKRQQASQELIDQALTKEDESLRKRAEQQVRAALILNSVAESAKISVDNSDVDAEYQIQAESMKIAVDEIRKHFESNSQHRTNLVYRLRERKTISFLLDHAKVTEKEISEDARKSASKPTK